MTDKLDDFFHDSEEVRNMQKSITPSGYFGNSADMIQEVENIMTVEEQDYILNFAKNIKSWDITNDNYNENGTIIYQASIWENRVCSYNNLMRQDPKIVFTMEKIIKRLQEKIQNFYNVKANYSGPAIVRWPVGAMQLPHADKELHEGPDAGKPGNFPWYDLGTVIYLNDDYEGGELYFPLQNIKFKPKPRAAYFFPGDKYFIHGVTPVTSGIRYTNPYFWTITELGDKNENN